MGRESGVLGGALATSRTLPVEGSTMSSFSHSDVSLHDTDQDISNAGGDLEDATNRVCIDVRC